MTSPNLCRAWREARGLTQAEAATALGLSDKTGRLRVSEYERGVRAISRASRIIITNDLAARGITLDARGGSAAGRTKRRGKGEGETPGKIRGSVGKSGRGRGKCADGRNR